MTSPYLEQPLVPLGVALPQMLESIEAETENEQLDPALKSRLRHRAKLIHWLLAPPHCGKRALMRATGRHAQ